MTSLRARQLIAVVVVLLLAVASYLALTVGVRYLQSGVSSAGSDLGRMPKFVYRPPETVPTTARYGPLGPVSLVFAGTDVRTGLTGEMDNPWIGVSSLDGSYRALSAPHLPPAAAGAVEVTPDGTLLAWAYDGGVETYDPVTDEARGLDGSDAGAGPTLGPFSPDGSRLVVFERRLRILDVESGQVLASLGGMDERAARQAVWTPDGRALTYVADGRLVTHEWRSKTSTGVPTTLTGDATLAWQPSGSRLAAMQETQGVRTVEIFDLTADGELTRTARVTPKGYAQQELLGFTGAGDVAVRALNRSTGPVEFVYSMSTQGDERPAEVTQLPGPGTNWVGPETLTLAAEPLAQGSTDFAEPRWPWSDRAKLVTVGVGALFVLGVYLTRRRRLR